MESKNMSEKEFEELQKLLAKELGSVGSDAEDSEITEMLRHEGAAADAARMQRREAALGADAEKQPQPVAFEFITEEQAKENAVQPAEKTPEQPSQPAVAAAPVTRGKYERVPEEEPQTSSEIETAPRADQLLRKPGKYEKVTEAPDGYFNPELPKESASERRKRAKRNTQLTRIALGLAVVFVVSLGVGLVVNSARAKKEQTSPEDQSAMSVQTSIDAEGNTVTLPADDGAKADSNILGIAPLCNFAAVLEGETTSLQISVTTKGTASASDLLWESSDPSIAEISEDGTITGMHAGDCVITVSAKADPSVMAKINCTVRHMEKRDGVTYIDDILLLNKSYGVDENYAPGGLTEETNAAFTELCADAAGEGLNIYLSSGYRSYYDQEYIYNNYVGIYGWEVADTFSARPGYSEHQSGLAIDVNTVDDAFGATPEAEWLKENCAKHGFIIRYAEDKVDITGYKYEPWHIRYVGKALAEEITSLGISLEEYLGVDSVYAEDWE